MIAREVEKLATMLRIGFAEMAAYRAELFIWFLTTTMPLIMYAMWSAVAQEGAIGRFDQGVFASYFLSTLIVRQVSSAWVVWELNGSIRSGQLSTALLRPVHPLLFYAAQNLGALPFRLVVLVPVVVLALIFIPEIELSGGPLHALLFVLTCAGAWLLNFVVQGIIGLLALYSQQSLSFYDAWFGLWAILGGYLIPLELMPGVQGVANWLPFRAMGSLPTEIILGHLDRGEIAFGVAVQVGWIALLFVVLRGWWGHAMRRFEAYGS